MTVALRVDVPFASFPTSRSREYRETYPVPPPSTVYGMLLSLVGETDRYKHCGIKIAIALLSEPAKSVTLRTMRRFKKKKLDHKENSRPDFQEILTDILCNSKITNNIQDFWFLWLFIVRNLKVALQLNEMS